MSDSLNLPLIFFLMAAKEVLYRRILFTVLWFLMYNRVKESNKPLEVFHTRLFLSLLSLQWHRLGEMPSIHCSFWLLLCLSH